LYTHLRRKGRKYRKRGNNKDSRGQLVNRVGIEKRPKEAEERKVFGHLEIDTIIGNKHKGAIVTLNDRASGMLWVRKTETRDAEKVSPWERGSNENLNGLVRQYIPKKMDFAELTDERVKEIETQINNRTRKRYSYESPIFVRNKLLFNP
jgi:transposase, IS30 family